MTKKIKGKPYGDAGWRVDRVRYINTDVLELCCQQDGTVLAAFHSMEEMAAFARMLHENMDVRGEEIDVVTKGHYINIISAIGDAVRADNTKKALEVMREIDERNQERERLWKEGRKDGIQEAD